MHVKHVTSVYMAADDLAQVVPIQPNLTIKPVLDYVFVKERPRGRTEGGIVIPDTSNSPRLAQWEVVAVGSSCISGVKPGDAVIIQPAFAMRTAIAGRKVALVKEEGIVAVVEGDAYDRAGLVVSGEGFVE